MYSDNSTTHGAFVNCVTMCMPLKHCSSQSASAGVSICHRNGTPISRISQHLSIVVNREKTWTSRGARNYQVHIIPVILTAAPIILLQLSTMFVVIWSHTRLSRRAWYAHKVLSIAIQFSYDWGLSALTLSR